ncbi:hypothetical protein HBI18_154730 [Parastagonospora nodorum]|nr:hypothetical protein HBH77_096560 [Parastagonospora nodorum]KAH5720771.1 hypothetical protein HBI18_154730 [Parastagonospora nodorum]KAH6112782.1 hypothetical protein HBI64_212930 [Parastagonospora nodorum]
METLSYAISMFVFPNLFHKPCSSPKNPSKRCICDKIVGFKRFPAPNAAPPRKDCGESAQVVGLYTVGRLTVIKISAA